MKLFIALFLTVSALRPRREGAWHWGYSNGNGAHWGDHQETCAKERQSPIDFPAETAEKSSAADSFNMENYDKEVGWTVENAGGHAVKLSLDNEEMLKVSGGFLPGPYQLAQFHFHWGSETEGGSEHLVDGHRHFAEIHLVHWKEEYGSIGDSVDKGDGLAVLGFFVDSTDDHEENELDELIQTHIGMKVPNPKDTVELEGFAMGSILPKTFDNYYRYMGSLTTPGCNEAVVWTVFKEPLKISQKTREMMVSFANTTHGDVTEVLVKNYRVAQDLHDRTVTFYSAGVTEEKEMPNSGENDPISVEPKAGEVDIDAESAVVTDSTTANATTIAPNTTTTTPSGASVEAVSTLALLLPIFAALI